MLSVNKEMPLDLRPLPVAFIYMPFNRNRVAL